MEFFEALSLYLSTLQNVQEGSLEHFFGLLEEAELSLALGQDAFSFRARFWGLKVADLLLMENGEIFEERLLFLEKSLDKELYSLGPDRESDALLFSHLGRCLKILKKEEKVRRALMRFSLPLDGKKAVELVKQTLFPKKIEILTDRHVRLAALTAWLTLIRQKVGSCFATAPAIFIQKNAPLRFFQDLYDLLTLGELKRVVHGKDYIVPFVFSSEERFDRSVKREDRAGLVFALEEVGVFSPDFPFSKKMEQITLYLHKKEGSIAKVLSGILLSFFDLTLEEVAKEEELEKIAINPMVGKDYFYQAPSPRQEKVRAWKKALEKAKSSFTAFIDTALLRAWEYTLASFSDLKTDFHKWNLFIALGLHSEAEGGIAHFLYDWLDVKLKDAQRKAFAFRQELEQALYVLEHAKKMRDMAKISMASHTARTAKEMQESYLKQAEAISHFYPSLMESLQERLQEHFQEVFDPSVFEESNFMKEDTPAGFRLIFKEGTLKSSLWSPIFDGHGYTQAIRRFILLLEKELFIPFVLGKPFLTELIDALLQYLEDGDFLEKASLRAKRAGRKSPWDYVSGGTLETLVESYYGFTRPLNLLECCPTSYEELALFLKQVKQGAKQELLMHSPTHAFVFNPQLLEEDFSFEVKEIFLLEEEAKEFFIEELAGRLGEESRASFIHLARKECVEKEVGSFQQSLTAVLKHFSSEASIDWVDSSFFAHWPLLSREEAASVCGEISEMPFSWKKERISALELKREIKKNILRSLKTALSPIDWDEKIEKVMRARGFFYARPFIFADTNWADWFFALLLHPLRKEVELWRVNRSGSQGLPMKGWQVWGSEKNKIPWIVLNEDLVF